MRRQRTVVDVPRGSRSYGQRAKQPDPVKEAREISALKNAGAALRGEAVSTLRRTGQMVNYCLDMRISVSADEVATHCVNDPEFTLKLLANLAARGIDCTQIAYDGFTGSVAQQQIPEFLERLARAILLVDTATDPGAAQ